MPGFEAVAEGMAHQVDATRCLEDRLHASILHALIMTSVPIRCKTVAAASAAFMIGKRAHTSGTIRPD